MLSVHFAILEVNCQSYDATPPLLTLSVYTVHYKAKQVAFYDNQVRNQTLRSKISVRSH